MNRMNNKDNMKAAEKTILNLEIEFKKMREKSTYSFIEIIQLI